MYKLPRVSKFRNPSRFLFGLIQNFLLIEDILAESSLGRQFILTFAQMIWVVALSGIMSFVPGRIFDVSLPLEWFRTFRRVLILKLLLIIILVQFRTHFNASLAFFLSLVDMEYFPCLKLMINLFELTALLAASNQNFIFGLPRKLSIVLALIWFCSTFHYVQSVSVSTYTGLIFAVRCFLSSGNF